MNIGKKKVSLLELCNLIADDGIKYAEKNKKTFIRIVNETTNREMSEDQVIKIFKVFSFLFWAYSNGVWSNLNKTTLRRDLMQQSMKSIVLKMSYELSKDKSNEAIAYLASASDQEFRSFVFRYNKRMEELEKDGYDADARTATLCGLEWIQEILGLNDEEMNLIVHKFNISSSDIINIQELAKKIV